MMLRPRVPKAPQSSSAPSWELSWAPTPMHGQHGLSHFPGEETRLTEAGVTTRSQLAGPGPLAQAPPAPKLPKGQPLREQNAS